MISNEAFISALAIMIPLIGVTVSVIALIVWIIVSYRRRKHEIDCRHKERMAAIEKGLELPPESPPQPATMPPRSRYLLRGLVWLGVGLAITFGGRDWLQGPLGGAGWIVVAIGAAYLIFYLVEGRTTAVPKDEPPASGGDQVR